MKFLVVILLVITLVLTFSSDKKELQKMNKKSNLEYQIKHFIFWMELQRRLKRNNLTKNDGFWQILAEKRRRTNE